MLADCSNFQVQIFHLIVDGTNDLKAQCDKAKHIITTSGPVHTVVILNAFPNLHDRFLDNLHNKSSEVKYHGTCELSVA